jgi:hypothetical protein
MRYKLDVKRKTSRSKYSEAAGVARSNYDIVSST